MKIRFAFSLLITKFSH